MSSSQPGPYQSKVLSSVIRETRRWVDQVSTAFRHIKVNAGWAAQILVYPVYVAFQTVRLVGAKIQQAVGLGLPELKAIAQPTPNAIPTKPSALTADTPIQQALLTVQAFSLPGELGIQVETPDLTEFLSEEPSVPLPTFQSIGRWAVAHLRSWAGNLRGTIQRQDSTGTLAHSAVGEGSLAAAGGSSLAQSTKGLSQAKAIVRGIASLVENKALVLVTAQNQILDILTIEQQLKLRQRIAWETAHYGRYMNLRQAVRKAVMPPTAENPHVLLPVRLFKRLMGWVQSSPIAIAVNLFQEGSLLLPGETPDFLILPATSEQPALENPNVFPAGLLQRLAGWVQANPLKAATNLFQQPPQLPAAENQALPVLPAAPEPQILPRWNSLVQAWQRALRRGAIVLPSRSSSPLAPLSQPSAISAIELTTAQISAQVQIASESPTFEMNHAPDYLETEALSIGYVLSPLEQILRWLDRFLLGIEKWLVKAWNWLVSLIKRGARG